jgi:hypothetical protein
MIEFDNCTPDSRTGILPDNIVWTPEIERLNRFIIESLRMQSRGCAVMGQQCNGKSFATRYLMSLLPTSLGHTVGVVRWTIRAPGTGSRTERAFIQERMIQSGCTAIAHRDLAVLWRRLHTHLADLAISAGSRWIVIMVDEAQNLAFEEYNRLIHCFNCLEDLKVKPFFMLVGQPELANASSSWKETNGMQVIGRFFTRTCWFRGINPKEVGLVLEAFDEPGPSGARMSAELMPQVFGTDFSLAHWEPAYEEALQVVMTEHQISGALRLPMQMLRSSLLLLLDRAIAARMDPRQVCGATVLQALRDTGFTSSLTYYVDPEHEDAGAEAAMSGQAEVAAQEAA